MSWRENWPQWQPPHDADAPDRDGGMSQLGAYEAGLTDEPGCWVQPVEVYWSPRLDPRSPEYDPEFAAQVEWEERGPGRNWNLGGERQRAMGYAWRPVAAQQEQAVGGRFRQAD
jgi:hypothetical protein